MMPTMYHYPCYNVSDDRTLVRLWIRILEMIVYHGSTVLVEKPEIRTAKFKKPTHQISFHTEAALGTLRFIGGEEVYEEE